VGATISVYDINGNQVFNKQDATGLHGTFYIQISESTLNEKFVIEATGGTVGEDGEIFDGTLRASICTYNEEHSYYELNPVTTLAAAYSDAHPKEECNQVETIIKAFLGISEEVDIFNELRLSNPHFSSEIFVSEMSAAGGLEMFLEQLLTEIEKTNQGHTMVLQAENAFEESLGGILLKGVVSGIGSNIGSSAAGWALNIIFGEETESSSVTPAEFNSQMNQLHTQLNDIQQSIQNLHTQINSAVNQILVGQEQVSYNNDATLLNTDIATIQTLDQRMGWITAAAADGQTELDDDVQDLIDRIDNADLLTVLNHINAILTGAAPGQQGLLEIWGNIMFSKSYSNKHFEELNQEFNYWANIQIQGLNLLIESEHYHSPDNQGNSANYLQAYLDNMALQVEMFIRSVEQQVTLWRTLNETQAVIDNFNSTDSNGNQVSPSWEGTVFVDYQQENSFLNKAQSIALQVQNHDRSIIVWVQMYSFLHQFGVHIDQPNVGTGQDALQLRNVDTGLTYTPQIFTTYNFDQGSWFPDYTDDSTTDIARYNFSQIPDGRYQITENYNLAFNHSPKTPLPQTYLDFEISIDPDNPIHNMLIIFTGTSLLFQ